MHYEKNVTLIPAAGIVRKIQSIVRLMLNITRASKKKPSFSGTLQCFLQSFYLLSFSFLFSLFFTYKVIWDLLFNNEIYFLLLYSVALRLQEFLQMKVMTP